MTRHNQLESSACEKLREEMVDFLAAGGEAPAALAEHLKQCSACAAAWREMRGAWELMDAWQAPEPSPYFDTRLQARLREVKVSEQQRGIFAWLGGRWRPAVAATAALGLVIVAGVVRTDHGATANETPSAVADLQNFDKNADVYTNFDMLYDDDQQAQQQNANP